MEVYREDVFTSTELVARVRMEVNREVFTSTELVSGVRMKRELRVGLKEETTLDSRRRRCAGGTLPLSFGL